jgi:autotransporter-associated beta strand protein
MKNTPCSPSKVWTLRVAALSCAILFAPAAQAQPYTWSGAGLGTNNYWTDTTNWAGTPATLAFTSSPATNTIGVVFDTTSTGQLTNRIGGATRINSLLFSNVGGNVIISNLTTAGGVVSFFFQGTNPTLTMSSGMSNAVTIDGGPVDVGNNLTIDHQGSGLLNILSQLRNNIGGDTGGVTKTGSGTLVLANDVNNFRGGLFIRGGSVLSSGSAIVGGFLLGSNSLGGNAVVNMQGGSLVLGRNGNSTYSNDVVVQSNSTITSGRFSTGVGFTYTFDGTLSIGSQTLTVNAQTNVTSGTAALEFLGATTLTGDAVVLVTNNVGGVATSLRLGAVNQSGGTRSLTKSGNGLLTLTAAGDYAGGTTISGGTLSVSNNTFLGATNGGVTLNGGTWRIAGGSAFSSARAVSLAASSTLDLSNTAGTTFTGLLSTTSSTNMLTMSGAGSLTLSPGSGQTNEIGMLRVTGGNVVTLTSGTTRLTSSAGGDQTAGLQLRNGTLVLNGGNLVTTNNAFVQFGNATLTINSNSTYTSGGNFLLGYGGTGTLNLAGGTNTVAGELRVVQSGTGVVNLDSGLLRLNIFIDTGTGTGTVNFNGATVQAGITTSNFANTTLTTYKVKAGGAVFDTDGRNITFGRSLEADTGSPGGGLTKNGAGTLTLSAANTYTGDTTVIQGALSLATNGSLRFVIGGSGTNNAITGNATTVLNGQFSFDLGSAATNTNASWTIVAATLTNSYGTNFIVSGFNGAGGLWTNTTNGVNYVFAQSNGILSVQATGAVTPYNAWVSYWQGVNPGFTNTSSASDPDGDTFNNNEEFAFDGNPSVGSPSLLNANRSGTNTVFTFVALTNTNAVTYLVQSTANLSTGPWTNASVTVTDSANQSGLNIPADYARREFVVPGTNSSFYRVRAITAP